MYRSIVVMGLERPQELFFTSLAERAEELRKANGSKDTLLSILSHDLRSPLAGIQSVAEFLVEDGPSQDPSELESALKEISQTARSSLDLLDRILDWARSVSGQLGPRPESLDLTRVTDEQVNLLAERAKAKGIDLERSLDREVVLISDRNMLAAIVRNLISNAVKFTPKGGHIRVAVEQGTKDAAICVRDSGVGLTSGEVSRLFRVDDRLRKPGTNGERGTGFGLVLSSEFAKKLGGRLDVTSESGKGSEFRLILPLAAST